MSIEQMLSNLQKMAEKSSAATKPGSKKQD